MAFSCWLIVPVAVTVEVRVWDCVRLEVVSQAPVEVAAYWAELVARALVALPELSWLIRIDWCACKFAIVGFPFVFVAEPSRLMAWVTQAVLLFDPVDCCVIDAVYCAVWVSPDTF